MTAALAMHVALAAALSASPEAAPTPTPLEAAAIEKVRAALPQRTVPETSLALVRAARRLARAAADGEPHPLSSSALRTALGEAGVHDPAPAAVLLSSRPASLPDALAAAAGFRGATHLGVGVELRDGLAWAVLLASERRAEIDPFPGRVAPGDAATLAGRLVRLDAPRVWVASPSGEAREIPVEISGGRFTAWIPFPEPGTWRVEVGGTGPRGATVAALLEVVSGSSSPPRRGSPTTEPSPEPQAEAAAAAVRAAVDALRAAQGLGPLRRDPALDEQARKHSAAMLAAGTVAHRLEGGPDVAARVAASGVAYRSARENVARGDGVMDAHRAMVESPAHLANLLAPEVTLLGLGTARGKLPGGQPVVYLTEILVEPRDARPAGAAPAGDR
jgi:uncharacterized protein YkwD